MMGPCSHSDASEHHVPAAIHCRSRRSAQSYFRFVGGLDLMPSLPALILLRGTWVPLK